MRTPVRPKLGASLLSGVVGLAVLLRLTGCADSPVPSSPAEPLGDAGRTVPPRGAALSEGSVTLVGAGDIASCSSSNLGDEATAAIINGLITTDPDLTVIATGDVVYNDATAAEFANCYDPTWGQFKTRTRPALGNHEYDVSPNPYFDYFNGVGSDSGVAGKRGFGYYSYDLGNWHIVVLNSNTMTATNSVQNAWLNSDLTNTSQPCVLAYWHHTRFASAVNSATNTIYAKVKPFWDALYAHRADVVVVSHQHFYERFAPQTPDGVADPQNGIRQFLVGTGGKSKGGAFQATAPNSEIKKLGTYGVLKLTLNASGYDWDFIPEAGQTFTDVGSGTCHPKNPEPAGTLTINTGNGQSATVTTAIAIPPSVKVTDAGGNPVAGVAVTFAVTVGGGSLTGAAQTTDVAGIATVGSWTMGTTYGTNRITATSPGLTGNPVTFLATATAGTPTTMFVDVGDNQTAPAGTAVPVRPSIRITDTYGNGVPNLTVTFAVISGGGSATGLVKKTGSGGRALVGSWTLGSTPGTNTLRATASVSGVAGNPVTFTATGN